MSEKKSYMTMEELAGFLLNRRATDRMGRNKELGTVYNIMTGTILSQHELDTAYTIQNQYSEADKKLDEIFKQIQHAKKNQNNPEARSFLESAQIIIGTRLCIDSTMANIQYAPVKPIEMLNTFLKLIDSDIKDEIVKYDSLRFLVSRFSNELTVAIKKGIWAKIIKNPNVVPYDFYQAIMALPKDDPTVKKLFSALEKKVKEIIKEESKKRLPDIQKVKNGKDILYGAAKYIDEQLFNQIQKIYDTTPDYGEEDLAKYLETVEESASLKIVELTSQVEEQQKELNATSKKLSQTIHALEQAQAEIEKQIKTNETKSEKLKQERKYNKQMIDAAKRLRIGIGSSGINNMRQLIEHIEQERGK